MGIEIVEVNGTYWATSRRGRYVDFLDEENDVRFSVPAECAETMMQRRTLVDVFFAAHQSGWEAGKRMALHEMKKALGL